MTREIATCINLRQVGDLIVLLDRAGFDAELVEKIINSPDLADIMYQAVINKIKSTTK